MPPYWLYKKVIFVNLTIFWGHAIESYDAIPYDSTPLTDTHPACLAALGQWFGMTPASPTCARVLELGCASGGNLIPMAWYLPGSTFVGVDRAAAPLAAGQALQARLGLSNLELRREDIITLDPKTLGEFDYIIVHGVWSWVPFAVQEQILRLCGSCLAPQGIAYVSYNTLPGWHPRGMVRDLLLYGTRAIHEPEVRLAAARGLLEQLATAWTGDENVLARYLTQEIAELRHAHPGYLFHEYLEESNTPILFADFIRRAACHGLSYLAESELYTMFPSTLSEGAAALVELLENLVDQEQYMDFLRYRYFRRTLLCRTEVPLTRNLDLNRLREFSISAHLLPLHGVDLTQVIMEDFTTPDGIHFGVSHPLTKAALAHLAEIYPDAITYPDLEKNAVHRVAFNGANQWNLEQLNGELFSLYAHRAVRLTSTPETFYHGLPVRPRSHALAQAQAAARLEHLATVRHTTLEIDPLAGQLIQLMDGNRTLEELTEALIIHLARHTAREVVRGGVPELPQDGQLLAGCRRLAELFARHGLLTDA
ncbi:Methyltransferase-like protein [Gammaproteobacteria bacterium]